MADIWLIRHGQAGDVMGDYDRLSDLGREQSRIAGAGWRHLGPIHHSVMGGMRRHALTAECFEEGFGTLPPVTVDEGFNEFDHQVVVRAALAAGITPPTSGGKAAFFEFFGAAMGRWADGAYDADYPEPYAVFQSRVVAGFGRLQARVEKGQTALVFTSGGTISAIVRSLLDLRPARAFHLNTVMVNTSFTHVQVGAGRASLVTFNNFAHLHTTPALVTRS
jgi:broad specificity phosphatase PhoE